MRRTLAPSAVVLLSLVTLVACGPIPGGTLSGTVTPAPTDWSVAVPDKRFCEIESRPAKPHSIQLECFRFRDGLYVNSHRWALAGYELGRDLDRAARRARPDRRGDLRASRDAYHGPC